MSATYSNYITSGSNLFKSISGSAFDLSGVLYLTNSLDNTILQVSTSGVVSFFSPANGSSTSFYYPNSLAFDPSGILYCSNWTVRQINKIDNSGVTSVFITDNTRLVAVNCIRFDTDGYLYASSTLNQTIYKYDINGIPIASCFVGDNPGGLAFDLSGTLYCSQYNKSCINKIDASFNLITPAYATSSILEQPSSIVVATDFKIYCTNKANFTVEVITPISDASANVSTFIGTSPGTFQPQELSIKSNYLYIPSSYAPGAPNYVYVTDDPLCFDQNTLILCLNEMMEEEYIPIKYLKKGDFVKTYLHGFRRIDIIHSGELYNVPFIWQNSMYKMEKTDDNGLLDDLIVTGGHSILVDEISDVEKENLKILGFPDFNGKIDDKLLLLVSASEKFVQIKDNKKYTYFHFTLEAEDDYQRFGVWANGLLTETTCKDYLLRKK